MFEVQQYINHAYRTVSRARSLGGAGLACQRLTQSGKFRVLAPKGKLVVLSGRVNQRGETEFNR